MMRGKEGMIKAGASELHAGVKRQTSSKPAGKAHGSPVGNETKANVRGAQEGGSMAEASGNPLTHAKHELHSQHPHAYHEHGPHHGTTEHIRHSPLHGMTPSKGCGR